MILNEDFIFGYQKGLRAGGGGGGGDLPTPTADGVALIGVGGEWKQQEGYGYSNELEQATLEPEEYAETYQPYRVADVPELPDGFGMGSNITIWVSSLQAEDEWSEWSGSTPINTVENGVYTFTGNGFYFAISTEDNASIPIDDEGEVTVTLPHKGVYFVQQKSWGVVALYTSGFAFGEDATEKLISWDGNLGGTVPISQNLVFPKATENGTALVYVDGEWKTQKGYGYESEGLTIEWDGDTEGHTQAGGDANNFYKVSDVIIPLEVLKTCTYSFYVDGEEELIPLSMMAYDFGGLAFSSYVFSGHAGNYGEGEAILPEDGTYFAFDEEMSDWKLIMPSTVQTIDPKFIPQKPVMELNVEIEFEEGYGYRGTCDKTSAEIYEAIQNGYDVIWDNSAQGMVFHYTLGDEYQSYLIGYQFNEAEPLEIGVALLKVGSTGDCSATYGWGQPARILTQQDLFQYDYGEETFGNKGKLVNDMEVAQYVAEAIGGAVDDSY